MCDWLKVSRSGYYAWLKREASQRHKEDIKLSTVITKIHQDSRGTYGSPRVHKALKQRGICIGKKRVERIMQEQGLQGRVVRVTRRQPGLRRFRERGENLRLDQPAPQQPDQVWVLDITYIKIRDTYKFLIVIMDLYSRRVLGWSLSNSRTTNDTVAVLKRVIKERQPSPGLIFHTDRGIEFTGKVFRDELRKYGIKESVNRLGYCKDNGHMESYFHTLKTELIRGRKFNNLMELRYALNSYINHFYNKKMIAFGDWLLLANRI